MKNLILCSIISIFMLSACTKERLTANGDLMTETRNLKEFNKIRIIGGNKVQVAYGNEFKVVLKGSSNLIPRFKSSIEGKTLDLGFKNENVNQDDIDIFITMPVIEGAYLTGSGNLSIDGSFAAVDELDLSITGSGDVTVNHELKVNELEIKLTGSGKVFFQKAIAKEADIEISGSGDAHVQVTDFLKARITGSGDVYYKGNPQLDSKVTGSGKLIRF